MGNKKKIRKKYSDIAKKNFLRKYKVRAFKIHKLGIVFGETKEKLPTPDWIAELTKKKQNRDFWRREYFNNPVDIRPKQLEGMLALEKSTDGKVKTVFAGSRDYKGSRNKY